MKTSELLSGKRQVTIVEPNDQHDGFVVKYSRASLSLNAVRAIRDADQIDAMADGLVAMGMEWNLTDDDGKPVPTTKESLMAQSIETLEMVNKAIQDDATPKAEN